MSPDARLLVKLAAEIRRDLAVAADLTDFLAFIDSLARV